MVNGKFRNFLIWRIKKFNIIASQASREVVRPSLRARAGGISCMEYKAVEIEEKIPVSAVGVDALCQDHIGNSLSKDIGNTLEDLLSATGYYHLLR